MTHLKLKLGLTMKILLIFMCASLQAISLRISLIIACLSFLLDSLRVTLKLFNICDVCIFRSSPLPPVHFTYLMLTMMPRVTIWNILLMLSLKIPSREFPLAKHTVRYDALLLYIFPTFLCSSSDSLLPFSHTLHILQREGVEDDVDCLGPGLRSGTFSVHVILHKHTTLNKLEFWS